MPKKPLLLLALLLASAALAEEREIIVYGQNAPEWNRKLGATATRSSCSAPPAACLSSMAALLEGQQTSHFYLNLLDDAKIAERAAELSQRSLEEPRLRELSIDDFADHFNGWCHAQGPRCAAFLRRIIDNTKGRNKALQFGVTIYEDQLAQLLADPNFPADLRGRIDAVHLYFHDRRNGPRFEDYLKQIKAAFPQAKVFAGSYAYDRLDYEKCADCTPAGHRELQRQTLRLEARLLREGRISGIEFYPGHFGWEEKLPAWSDPRVCRPERRSACVENTKAMHDDVLPILKSK